MPSVQPIPQGYHTITPYLHIRGAAEAIELYKRAFGAEEVMRMQGPDGKVMHAEIRIGDSIIMIGDENLAMQCRSPLTLNGTPGGLHIYTADVDAAWAKATAAGLTVTMPLSNMFWGDRYGMLQDKFGHQWSMAQHVEDLSEDEIRRRGAEAMECVQS